MPAELRHHFHDRLALLRATVVGMAEVVTAGITAVTTALLEGDPEAGAAVVVSDQAVDRSYPWVEAEVFDLVARQAPVAGDLRLLMASLRIAQEVERSGDLVASVGRRVARLDPEALTTPVRALLYQMGAEGGRMFRAATDAYARLDDDLAGRVAGWDDSIDDLHHAVLRELFAAGAGRLESIVELGLIARFYERVADHAVVIAERVGFVVSGRMRAGDADESTLGWAP